MTIIHCMNTAGFFFVPPLFILLRKRSEFLSVPSYAGTAEISHRHRVRASVKESIGDQQEKI